MQQAGVSAAFSGGLGASPIPTTRGPQPPSSIPPSPSFFPVEVGPLRQSADPGPPAGGGRGQRQIQKMRPLASPWTAPPPFSRRRRGSPTPRRRGRCPAADCSRAGDPARPGGSRSRRLHLRPHPSGSPSPRSISHSSICGEVHGRRGGGPRPPQGPALPLFSPSAGAPLSRSSLFSSPSALFPCCRSRAVELEVEPPPLLELHLPAGANDRCGMREGDGRVAGSAPRPTSLSFPKEAIDADAHRRTAGVGLRP
jgi:hypothetical protein